jgi:hypothetical protein
MFRIPLHINKDKLSCNRCIKDIDKFTETLLIEGEVHCIFCDNWLCGEYDAFGNIELIGSPSIQHIKMVGGIINKKDNFIPSFLEVVGKILHENLPNEGNELELMIKSYNIILKETGHFIKAFKVNG